MEGAAGNKILNKQANKQQQKNRGESFEWLSSGFCPLVNKWEVSNQVSTQGRSLIWSLLYDVLGRLMNSQ